MSVKDIACTKSSRSRETIKDEKPGIVSVEKLKMCRPFGA
jgi:hypothetical protein